MPGDADGLVGELDVVADKSASGQILYRVIARVAWSGSNGIRAE